MVVGAFVVGAEALPNDEEFVQPVPPPPPEVQLEHDMVVVQQLVAVPQLELVKHQQQEVELMLITFFGGLSLAKTPCVLATQRQILWVVVIQFQHQKQPRSPMPFQVNGT